MNQDFIDHALANPKGQQWLESIPNLIKKYEQQWQFTVQPPFTLNYNYVAPVVHSDGSHNVIKIGYPGDNEFQTEKAALHTYNTPHVINILKQNDDDNIILIPQIEPGTPLSTIQDDTTATQIIADTIKRIQTPIPKDHPFIPIKRWAKNLPRFLTHYTKDTAPFDYSLVHKAYHLLNHLLETSQPDVLIHGDLHHDNILKDQDGNWIVIDPKGIAAEPVYETAAMIRNPYPKLEKHPNIKNILTNRIHILSQTLGFDPQRILDWGFTQTVLSAVWSAEESESQWSHAIYVAKCINHLRNNK